MKKPLIKLSITFLLSCLLLFAAFGLTGCDIEFAKREYASDNLIANSDRNIMISSVRSNINGGCTYKAKKFDGRYTIWQNFIDGEKDVVVQISLSLTNGKAKIAYVDSEKNVVTLIECTPDTSTNEPIECAVTLKKGTNTLKIVGYDCKNVSVKIIVK